MENEKTDYGKRPLWQWLLFYAVIAIVAYGAIYYLFLNKGTTYQTPAGESPEITQEQPQESEAKTIKVVGTEFKFEPATLTFKAGEKVRIEFKNEGQFPHNLTISDLNVATKTIQAGETDTVEFTPDRTGTFGFICTVDAHADRGMIGTAIVE